jgi:hypothetical protein
MNNGGTDDAGSRWVGWLRRHRNAPWVRVCQADGMGQAAKLLAAEADRRGVRPRDCCLTTGMPPRLHEDGRGDARVGWKSAEGEGDERRGGHQ